MKRLRMPGNWRTTLAGFVAPLIAVGPSLPPKYQAWASVIGALAVALGLISAKDAKAQ